MIAKWDGKCSICKQPIKGGTDVHYDAEAKTIQCWPCWETPALTAADIELAERLFFKEHEQAIQFAWSTMQTQKGLFK